MSKEYGSHLHGNQLLGRLSELERRLGEVEGELEQAQKLAALGAFAMAVAHEFNNLLTPMVNYARMALSRPDDRELVEKALNVTLTGAEHAAGIANVILGFRDEGQQGVTDVGMVVKQSLACLSRDPKADGIDVTTNLDPGCHVAMTSGALQQVVLNLVLNALKALRSVGGGRLQIQARCSTWNTGGGGPGPAGGRAVEIRIADNGPGIPRAIRERLFEPFPQAGGRQLAERAKRDNALPPPGTGLGLAICKRLVETAGGQIAVTSAQGEGAAFTITLPASGAAAGAAA